MTQRSHAGPPRRSGWVMPLIFAVLIGLPILEVFLLVQVGQWIGVWATIGLLVATALLGTWLMRREGMKAWRALRDALGTTEVPSRELTDGALVLVGGVLLTLPGFTTDLIGLACLLPFTRPLPRRLLLSFADRQVSKIGLGAGGFGGGLARRRGDVIPGEVVDEAPRTSGAEPPAGDQRAIEGRVID